MKKMLMSVLVLLALTTTGSLASSDDHYKKRMSSKDIFERLDQNYFFKLIENDKLFVINGMFN